MIKKIISVIILCGAFLMYVSERDLFADVTSVTLTPIDSPTTLSNGLSYYLAGRDYRFRVQAVDPAATGQAYWGYIDLNFNAGTAVCRVLVPTNTASIQTNLSAITINNSATTVWTNLDYTITVRFQWSVPAQTSGLQTVVATVQEPNAPASSQTDTRNIVYGFVSDIKVVNFSQTGDAVDARINPRHTAFTVTGSIVYSQPTGDAATGAADTVHTLAALTTGEITGLSLLRNAAASGCAIAGDESGFTFNVPANHFNALALGDYNWSVECTMATAGGPKTSTNSLLVNNNRVQIDNIEFYNGGGGTLTNPYYRSALVAGTRVRITASIENTTGSLGGITTMKGLTTFELQFGSADVANAGYNAVTVTINAGANTGDANVTLPTVGEAADQYTTAVIYRVRQIHTGAYDDQNATTGSTITHTPPVANRTIYWDRNDPPNNPYAHAATVFSAPFTPLVSAVPAAGSITFVWTALPTCPDFYTYRIYYKINKTAGPFNTWTIIDRTTPGYGPLQTYDLSLPATGTAVITGLVSLTNYDYLISAVDIFGNEVALVNRIGYNAANPDPDAGTTIPTSASSTTVSITDGITAFDDNSFTMNLAANARVFRQSAIRTTFVIIASDTIPDKVNMIIAADALPDLINTATWTVNGVEGVNYYRISCTKTAPNTYVAYVPTTNPLITMGSSCRFVVEVIRNSISSYSDHNSESETPVTANPNDSEWTFSINTATNFAPWPTRILNNVISNSHPTAYPSYYLTDDAYVSITVYDIKGRSVVTLIDNAFRNGGQNIKENGWSGYNKAGNKCGVGLYYVHFKAKRTADGKQILNDFKKVVITK